MLSSIYVDYIYAHSLKKQNIQRITWIYFV
jgi:hypothetical protein